MGLLKQEDDLRLAERAAQWLGALEETNTERAAFFNWLAESPRHVDAFLAVLITAQEVAGLTAEQLASIERMAGDNEVMAGNIVRLTEASVPATPSVMRKKRWLAGMAAGLLLALGAWFVAMSRGEIYATAIGEQRVLELEDGSLVHLNTSSRLEVRYTQDSRSLRLLSGQALFDVKPDGARPFLVYSGDTAIQAIGTRFDVYRRASDTRVSVIEGVVRISPEHDKALLKAGESAEISAAGKIVERKPLDLVKTTAWRQRRLVFREDTLGDIAAEFNRYNASLQIRVEGEAAIEQHFSGTFDADAPEALMQALAGDDTLMVERTEREIVIRER